MCLITQTLYIFIYTVYIYIYTILRHVTVFELMLELTVLSVNYFSLYPAHSHHYFDTSVTLNTTSVLRLPVFT